jgi:hypothetical protein
MLGMYTPSLVMQEEKRILLLKTIEWAQKHKIKVESLSVKNLAEAIRCKL